MSSKMPDGRVCPEQFRGWLLKWTNYIKGYQRRWFVLSNGLLSYYRTQEEMAHTCRGTINLAAAFVDTIDSTNFVITNGPSQVYHLRALNEIERQRWVTALELAKAKAIKKLESDDTDSRSGSDDESGSPHDNPLAGLQEKLRDLNTAHDLVVKNSHQMTKHVSEMEEGGRTTAGKMKEKLALFKLTSSAMVKTAEEFMVQARSTERRWSRALQHEHSLRLQLQENMEALANQMHGLEDEARMSVQGQLPFLNTIASQSNSTSTASISADSADSSSVVSKGSIIKREGKSRSKKKVATFDSEPDGIDSDDEDKFFDAPEISAEDWVKATGTGTDPAAAGEEFVAGHRRSVSTTSVNDAQAMMNVTDEEKEQLPVTSDKMSSLPTGPPASFFVDRDVPTLAMRRTSVPPKPLTKLNLWTVMKNCIGKDLSKIPMPVNFNEPLSLLQRMTEDLAYSYLLTKAAACSTTTEEVAYVASFINSAYASTATRVGKPFNPLLYETFECDRRAEPDQGWRCIVEQVSHHPPMFAMHVEHKQWTFWQEYTVASKFRGKYLVCYPLGCCHLLFHRSQSHYTWTKVTTTIHNIIVGKLWIDQSGELKITNHTKGEECKVKYHAYSYFSRERQRKITGTITNPAGDEDYIIKGHWDEQFDLAQVISGDGRNKVTAPPVTLWTVDPPHPGNEAFYGFSKFACSLNEMEEGVAPTDCRHRPDQRVMEEQDFDKANNEKVRLEEKQRAKRRKREALAAEAAEAAAAGNVEEAESLKKEASVTPVWFTKEYDPLTKTMMHVYKGRYWEAKQTKNWEQFNLPDLF